MALLSSVIDYGLLSARPAAGSAGRIYYATDTMVVYRDNGTSWDTLHLGEQLLGEVVVPSGGQSSISFSSIDQGYRSLRLLLQGAATVTGSPVVRAQFNSDTGSNYDTSGVWGSVSNSLQNFGALAQTSMEVGQVCGTDSTSGYNGNIDLTIHNYAGTAFHKTIVGLFMIRQSAGTNDLFAYYMGGMWHSTSAINSLLLFLSSGNFAQNSVARLYGLA